MCAMGEGRWCAGDETGDVVMQTDSTRSSERIYVNVTAMRASRNRAVLSGSGTSWENREI